MWIKRLDYIEQYQFHLAGYLMGEVWCSGSNWYGSVRGSHQSILCTSREEAQQWAEDSIRGSYYQFPLP